MSDTSSGLLRVVVLLMATAGLATVWEGDQLTQQQFIVARRMANEAGHQKLFAREDRTSGIEASIPEAGSELPQASSISQDDTAAEASYVARVEVEMPLPSEITPGTYQVVDEHGLGQRIRVVHARQASSARDIYVLEQSGRGRQFFIRVTDAAVRANDQVALEQLPQVQ